jgi:hypothetical protein
MTRGKSTLLFASTCDRLWSALHLRAFLSISGHNPDDEQPFGQLVEGQVGYLTNRELVDLLDPKTVWQACVLGGEYALTVCAGYPQLHIRALRVASLRRSGATTAPFGLGM